MIRIEDIKIGSVLQINKCNLIKIAGSVFADKIDPLGSIDRIQHIKVIDIAITDKKCEIVALFKPELAACVDIVDLAMYSIFSDFKETPIKKESEKSDADRFKEITDKMFDTFKAKKHDYGSSFSNLFKECGMTYAYGHMAEKLERVKSLMKDDAKVKGESMKDSLYDLANYAILTIMQLEKKEK